jgi:hypothetical protein
MLEVQQMQQKRIKESFFNEDERLQFKIATISAEISLLLKKGESKIKELGNCSAEDTNACNKKSKFEGLLTYLFM